MITESDRSLFESQADAQEVEEVVMSDTKLEPDETCPQPDANDPSNSDASHSDADGDDSDVMEEDITARGDRFMEGVRAATTRSKGRLAPRKRPQQLNSRVSDWKKDQRDRASRMRERKRRLEEKHVAARELNAAAVHRTLFDRSITDS